MKCEEILLFRSRTDGKWMPFELGNGWDLEEHPVSGCKIKIVRSFDNQIGHFRWEDDSGRNGSLPFTHPGGHLAVRQLQEENDPRSYEPLPELGGVEDQESPVSDVEQVREVEDFKVASTANEGHGTDDHQGEYDDQGDASHVGHSRNQTEDFRSHGEQPLVERPRPASVVGIAQLALGDV